MSLPDLATFADVATRLQRALTAAEQDAATAALAAASAVIRGEVRQDFTLVADDTISLTVTELTDWLPLPQHPVSDVAEVQINGQAVTDFVIRAGRRGTRLYRRVGWYSPSLPIDINTISLDPVTFVDVTHTHGYDPIPADVVAVAVNIALPQVINPKGMRSETFGDYSYQSDGGAAVTSPWLLTVEDLRRRYQNRSTLRSVQLRRTWSSGA